MILFPKDSRLSKDLLSFPQQSKRSPKKYGQTGPMSGESKSHFRSGKKLIPAPTHLGANLAVPGLLSQADLGLPDSEAPIDSCDKDDVSIFEDDDSDSQSIKVAAVKARGDPPVTQRQYRARSTGRYSKRGGRRGQEVSPSTTTCTGSNKLSSQHNDNIEPEALDDITNEENGDARRPHRRQLPARSADELRPQQNDYIEPGARADIPKEQDDEAKRSHRQRSHAREADELRPQHDDNREREARVDVPKRVR